MKLTFPPTTFPKRIFWLVVVQVAIGLLAALSEHSDYGDTWKLAFFVGIVFSQISLLGIWGGLGGNILWQRLIGVVLGVGYLTCIFGLPWGEFDAAFLVLVVSGTVIMMVVMLIVRFIAGPIRPERLPVVAARRHQFSIRHLLIVMSVIACLTAIGKLVQPLVDASGDLLFVGLILYAVMYDVIGIIPVWFVLATKRPVIYGIFVVAVEACLAYCLGRIANSGSNAVGMLVMTVLATEAMSVAVSLLVVRSCGYRLMRMPPSDPVMSARNGEQ